MLRSGVFEEVKWEEVRVGDILKVRNSEVVPSDMLLLYSTEENSMCFVETANLDGESNLKEKFAYTEGVGLSPEEFEKLEGELVMEAPTANLHEFDGKIRVGEGEQQYFGIHNVLLRETTLRNSEEIVGVALFCGYDTKILKNQGYLGLDVGRCTTK